MSVVAADFDEQPSEEDLKALFTQLLQELAKAKSVVEMNIAAGVTLERVGETDT